MKHNYTITIHSPLPVSPVISLMFLSGYWLNTVKMSTTSFGLNHNVDDTCPALIHILGHDKPHFLTDKSYKNTIDTHLLIHAIHTVMQNLVLNSSRTIFGQKMVSLHRFWYSNLACSINTMMLMFFQWTTLHISLQSKVDLLAINNRFSVVIYVTLKTTWTIKLQPPHSLVCAHFCLLKPLSPALKTKDISFEGNFGVF